MTPLVERVKALLAIVGDDSWELDPDNSGMIFDACYGLLRSGATLGVNVECSHNTLKKRGEGWAEAAGFAKFAGRVANGEFDATKEESDEWARSPSGQDAAKRLSPEMREIIGLKLNN